jgi:trimeric autotransporter adhesin
MVARMRWLGILLLVGCSFPRPPSAEDGPPGDGPRSDGPGSDGSGGAIAGRRIALTIAAGKVTEVLTDFPVYVDVTDNELKTKLDLTQLSFKQRSGGTVVNLPYEVQSFDKNAGRLRAWVLLPRLDTAENGLELQYGDAAVAAAPNPAEVWRNHFKAVFHLESSANPIADSRGIYPGTPANLKTNASQDAKLGKGLEFDNNQNSVISFANPIKGTGPSTISLWVNETNPLGKESLVHLGSGDALETRWLNGQFNINEVGLGLGGSDWINTALNINGQGWKLLHWTYENQVSRLYQDAALVGTPYTHSDNANTTGDFAWLGNARAQGFDINAALNGLMDEVRISDVARSAGWIAAELANQSAPATFVTHEEPSALP